MTKEEYNVGRLKRGVCQPAPKGPEPTITTKSHGGKGSKEIKGRAE